ncbi:MAG: class I SAM-dependent methyltransferase [Ferruginibacter sp.]
MRIPASLQQIIFRLPYFGKKLKVLDNCGYAPGHYYSPIPDLNDIRNRRTKIFHKASVGLNGIDLRISEQFSLLQSFSKYYNEIPYNFNSRSKGGTRYQVNSEWYKFSDVVMLYSVMRHFKPSRIIEIGSGYSSAVMLDVNERFFNSTIQMTFIDPYPERLLGLLTIEDKKKHTVLRSMIQEADITIFNDLEANDILFIDSSHISKVGSDLNYILFEILPRLKPGVHIHFHDIFFPFELPENWILERKWFWNENYILRAFLTESKAYAIINFNTYLHKEFRSWLEKNMPACLIEEDATGSIWITKI